MILILRNNIFQKSRYRINILVENDRPSLEIAKFIIKSVNYWLI